MRYLILMAPLFMMMFGKISILSHRDSGTVHIACNKCGNPRPHQA